MVTLRRRQREARRLGSRSSSSAFCDPDDVKTAILPPNQEGRQKVRTIEIDWTWISGQYKSHDAIIHE
jgi:hypothetical protein